MGADCEDVWLFLMGIRGRGEVGQESGEEG